MLLSIVLWPIAIALLLLSITPGPWYWLWPIEIIGAAYFWFMALTALLLLGLLLLKRYLPQPKFLPRRRLIITLALALGIYICTVGAWYVPRLRDARPGGTPLTVMTYNVNVKLWDAPAVIDVVRANPVDVLGLVEPSKEQASELRDNVKDLYPYYYRATGGGLSLFSRYPLTETTTENLGTPYHSLFAVVDVAGKPVRIVVTHPLIPVPFYSFLNRNELIAALANYGSQQTITTVIMGDFNLTSWSIYFRQFIQQSGLRSAKLGHGIHPTWFYSEAGRSLPPLDLVKQGLKIPLDHVFVSENVCVDQVTTATAGISDHRPIIAKLRVL